MSMEMEEGSSVLNSVIEEANVAMKDPELNRAQYAATWTTLFHQVPGPLALVWGLCAVGQFAILAHLVSKPVESFGVFIGSLLGLWFFQALQKGLYAPLRDLVDIPDDGLTLGTVLGMALRRLGAIAVVQLLIGFIFSVITVVFLVVGAPLFGVFVVLQMFWFLFAPAVYFAVVRRDSAFQALQRALVVARRHLVWIVGIPALFWCVGTFLDPYIWDFVDSHITAFASDPLIWMRGLFLYVLFRYLRWLSVTSVYINVDAVTDDDSTALIIKR